MGHSAVCPPLFYFAKLPSNSLSSGCPSGLNIPQPYLHQLRKKKHIPIKCTNLPTRRSRRHNFKLCNKQPLQPAIVCHSSTKLRKSASLNIHSHRHCPKISLSKSSKLGQLYVILVMLIKISERHSELSDISTLHKIGGIMGCFCFEDG